VRLSICMLVAEPLHRVRAALEPVRHLADEVVIAADSRVDEARLAGYAQLADRLYRVEFTRHPRILGWLNAQCRGRWILQLEGDEVPSAAFAAVLPSLLARDDVRQVWGRRDWIAPDGGSVLDDQPWSADFVARLVRNEPGLRFSGEQHAHAVFERPADFVEQPVYHLPLALTSLDERRVKAVRYEATKPGLLDAVGARLNESAYLPELRSALRTRPIPAADAARLAHALGPAPDEPPAAPAAAEPVHFVRAELDRFYEGRAVHPSAYRARIASTEEPVHVAPGHLRAVYLRVTNDGDERWPWGLDQRPAIRMGYRWLRPDGSLVTDATARTPFPRPVAPGDTVVVPLDVAAPAEPGEYLLEADVVHEGVRWFGAAARVRTVVGPPPALPAPGPRLAPTPRPSGPLAVPRLLHRVALDAPPAEPGPPPDWEVRTWTGAHLAELGITAEERDTARTAAELAHLVRYEALARHGGVCAEVAVDAAALEALLGGVRALAVLEDAGRLGTALLAAVPGHPLFVRAARDARPLLGIGDDPAGVIGGWFLTLLVEQEPGGVTVLAAGDAAATRPPPPPARATG